MRSERLNQWPDRGARPDLYEHSLKKLAKVLGMTISPSDEVAASWLVAMQWRREYMYYPEVSRVAAEQIYEAVFDEQKGVVAWISRNYL